MHGYWRPIRRLRPCLGLIQPCFTASSILIRAAQRLFALLREADVLGKELVVVVWDNQEGLGLSVTNRLLRASAFTVLSGHGEIDACGRKIVY